jgi:hypothetical protein
MGEWEGKYFDSLIPRSNYDGHSLDRDKWLGFIPPQRAIVSTMPLRMRWEDVHELISNLAPTELASLWHEMPKYNHRRTRTFRQSGGFMRPRFFWEADIPKRHNLVPLKSMWAPTGFEGMPEFDESASRVTPSTAIKVKLIGIENARLRPDCEAFYFYHSDIPVSGLYRRKLWPEPSEDPVYGLIWNEAVLAIMTHTDEIVAVDDPDKGAPGSGLPGRRREADDGCPRVRRLDEGQLEDAREAVASGAPTPYDWIFISGSLASVGDKRGGVRAAINAVRLNPFDVLAGTALAGALWQMGRDRWTRIVLTRVEGFAPNDTYLLYSLAVAEIEDGKYQSAFLRLKKALKSFDQTEGDLPRYLLLERLLFVAEQLGEPEVASWARAALETYMSSGGVVADDVVFEE